MNDEVTQRELILAITLVSLMASGWSRPEIERIRPDMTKAFDRVIALGMTR